MAQSPVLDDYRTRRSFLDPRGLARNIIQRRSWFLAFLVLDAIVIYAIVNSPVLMSAWNYIWPGIKVTVQLTVLSFIMATIIGLFVALARVTRNVFVYNTATLYVELFRGLPLLVIILIFNFAITPALVTFIAKIPVLDDLAQHIVGIPPNLIPTTTLSIRNIPETTRILFAFALTYGAFMCEVFRAGIESISRGQTEAARSLGMTYIQAMRYIILPQAVRATLPAMANNFVLLLKDTSLAYVVAVPEISYLTTQYAANNFRYPEALLCLSLIYANLTIVMSLGVYWLEARLQTDRRED